MRDKGEGSLLRYPGLCPQRRVWSMPTTLNWQGWHEWAVQVCDGVLNSVVGRAHRGEHCAKICRPFLQIYPAGFFLSY